MHLCHPRLSAVPTQAGGSGKVKGAEKISFTLSYAHFNNLLFLEL